MEKERHRISWFTAGMLMGVAVCVDFIQLVVGAIGLIPIIGWIFAPLFGFLIGGFAAGVLFLAWLFVFKFDMREFLRMRRVISFTVTGIAELIPIVSVLPLWSIQTVLLIRSVWGEDKKHNAELKKKQQGDRESKRRVAFEAQAANDNRPQTNQQYEDYSMAA